MQTYFFDTETEWKGGRQAVARGGGIPELQLSAPVEFHGLPGFWTPEFLLVAAAEVCLMETFLGMCEWSRLNVAGYRSAARGKLEKVEGSLRFTEIVIRPHIQVQTDEQGVTAGHIMEKAKRACLVANSLRTVVAVEPVVQVLQPA